MNDSASEGISDNHNTNDHRVEINGPPIISSVPTKPYLVEKPTVSPRTSGQVRKPNSRYHADEFDLSSISVR